MNGFFDGGSNTLLVVLGRTFYSYLLVELLVYTYIFFDRINQLFAGIKWGFSSISMNFLKVLKML